MTEGPTRIGEGLAEALGGLAEALDEPAGRSRFLRGLAIGALIGAAIVGALLGMGARRDRPADDGTVRRRSGDRA